MIRRAFLASLLAVFASYAAAQPPDARALRILFIGNSLTYTGDIPGRLAKLASAMGRKATVEAVAFPDLSLEDHWRDGRALAAIRKGWDVVVLQQGPSSQPDSRAQLVDYSKRFAKPIREAGARPALYMVWPSVERMRDFPGAIGAYREAATAVDGILLPVGRSVAARDLGRQAAAAV